MSLTSPDQERAKRAAATAAIERLAEWKAGPECALGVGTGSTTNCFIDMLHELEEPPAVLVASSEATRRRLEEAGFGVTALADARRLDFYVDGADEAAPDKALIKGGGGALTGEKILVSVSAAFICIVDRTKVVSGLGAFPLPIEVVPLAKEVVAARMESMGGRVTVRPELSEYGNVILDVKGIDLSDRDSMEVEVNNLPGVVTNGLFAAHRPKRVIVGLPSGGCEIL
ncbi:MAG: ribose-5-phosphate isomerase RpiA [Pseudomonadales bacterium]|nr:ribose-5-phosphate isomerase RpiA [Pseudomonadales bacterium]